MLHDKILKLPWSQSQTHLMTHNTFHCPSNSYGYFLAITSAFQLLVGSSYQEFKSLCHPDTGWGSKGINRESGHF
jgi:hypothetical protein